MTTLHKHIQGQQSIAVDLSGVIEAISILNNEGTSPGPVVSLINVALDLANQLCEGLDSVRLPKVAA